MKHGSFTDLILCHLISSSRGSDDLLLVEAGKGVIMSTDDE